MGAKGSSTLRLVGPRLYLRSDRRWLKGSGYSSARIPPMRRACRKLVKMLEGGVAVRDAEALPDPPECYCYMDSIVAGSPLINSIG
ncbi:hypothetical protein GUJ93_ZPchr0012g20975 [Zizania palustris]|uniref:Uncharacterized protein n=1 Tax=Zizania palustris TaxID=103762 RepID=A0A8J5WQZ7_ZIZPA|nr:hypothetical protein GUJ93_ZPchr0012g20975 [Zizania palustris]